jgi:hypothetical protein
MTVEELKTRRNSLEHQILRLVEDFMKETDVEVRSIDLQYTMSMSKGLHVSRIKVEVQLP